MRDPPRQPTEVNKPELRPSVFQVFGEHILLFIGLSKKKKKESSSSLPQTLKMCFLCFSFLLAIYVHSGIYLLT
jgi:hypothetical protein